MSGETIPTRKASVSSIKANRLTTGSGRKRVVVFYRDRNITCVVFEKRRAHNENKFA
jgi:hypothetical protein